MRALRVCVSAFVVVSLAGCAVAPLGPPVPSIENVAKARAASMPPVALGAFSLAAGRPAAMDQKVTLRTNTLRSPVGDSFAGYLKESFAGDLRAAGLLDPTAPVVISAQLTDNQLDVPVGPASATVAARFIVTRAGAAVYDRELRARSHWDAPFVGLEALPMAINRYEVVYRQLTGALLDDPEFRAAVRH